MRLLIYGEIILDKYYISTTNRTAPEVDIPIYLVNKTENKLGGAANVALNLKDHCDIEFISVLGNDEYYKEIINLLNSNNINNKIFLSNRKCIIKNRTICDNNIVNRFDVEDTYDIPDNLIEEILLYLEQKISTEKIDGFIISDYNKGIIPHKLCQGIINLCNKSGISTFIDPKIKDINKYINCTFFKPNLVEAYNIIENNSISDEKLLETLHNNLNCKYLLITKGADGMIGYDGNKIINIQHKENISVIDVTGAGDIIIAVLTYIYLLSNDFGFACKISNYIGGKSVQYLGNYKFTLEDIKNSNNLIYSTDLDIIKNLRKIHTNIIFTNGCFDIVHTGHIKLLKYCRSIGSTIVLGLNSDKSIKNIKGETRPINNQNDRIEFIQLLELVDYIIIFDEETPINIIKNLEPDILVKGSDYNINNVIGKEYCKEVLFFNLVPNKSTTNIIKKIYNII
jgi:D-beta-D-heptose 7-phosphate kinase/D-beta-D-heptose 1-phosphate adenosyltransferase